MRRTTQKSTPTHPKTAKLRARTAGRPARRMLDGIPLKRKVVWAYDLDSPEFKKRHIKEMKDIRQHEVDRDGMQFIEAVLADPDVQKWWK